MTFFEETDVDHLDWYLSLSKVFQLVREFEKQVDAFLKS